MMALRLAKVGRRQLFLRRQSVLLASRWVGCRNVKLQVQKLTWLHDNQAQKCEGEILNNSKSYPSFSKVISPAQCAAGPEDSRQY